MTNHITSNREKIIAIFSKQPEVRPIDLVRQLGIGHAMVHRYLLQLQQEGIIIKKGTPPTVFYSLVPTDVVQSAPPLTGLTSTQKRLLEDSYLYISPSGQFFPGAQGLYTWSQKSKQTQSWAKLVSNYLQTRTEANQFLNTQGLINATPKITSTFKQTPGIDKVFLSDFYALPRFGKTALGNMVYYAKASENKQLIAQLAPKVEQAVTKLIAKEKIEMIGWLPHSLPRKIPFLKQLRSLVQLPNLPHLELVKAYQGEVIVAQKSLTSLHDRIQNARETIILKNTPDLTAISSILLIDDAVGSGATFNEVARKLKTIKPKLKIVGYAIVGSMNGFDVVREI